MKESKVKSNNDHIVVSAPRRPAMGCGFPSGARCRVRDLSHCHYLSG